MTLKTQIAMTALVIIAGAIFFAVTKNYDALVILGAFTIFLTGGRFIEPKEKLA